jgi:DNA primase
VAVVFDPDEAGRKALGRSLDLFLAGNVRLKAVVLPDGYDPDDFVRTFGPERFKRRWKKPDPPSSITSIPFWVREGISSMIGRC